MNSSVCEHDLFHSNGEFLGVTVTGVTVRVTKCYRYNVTCDTFSNIKCPLFVTLISSSVFVYDFTV